MAAKTILILIFSIFILSSSAEVQDDPILHLSQSNFSSITDGKDFIVLFFAPWCGHCQRFKPAWTNFAKEVQGTIGVGEVDGTKESSLMNKFGVRGYPTVFLLKNGKRTQYNGNRTVEDLKNFIGYVDPNPTPVPKSPGVGPLPEIKTNQTKPVPVPQSGSQKNETKFEPTKNETISDSQNTIGTPKPEKAITVATEDPKTSMNDAWLKVLIVGTIFLAFGMIFLFRRYIKQNRDTLSRLDTVEQEELEVEGP